MAKNEAKSGIRTNTEERELVITRVFDAARARVEGMDGA